MYQIDSDQIQLTLISQGNNSYIHRVKNNKTYVLKSVYHTNQLTVDQKQSFPKGIHHQLECQDLKNEYEILSGLSHPHIIQAKTFTESKLLSLSSQNIECCSLQLDDAQCDLFNLYKNCDQPDVFPLKNKLNYFKQISNAVEYIHQLHISHNDIKLENILVSNREVAKLADFGFASRDQLDLGSRWERRSLNYYSAPEIIELRNTLKELKEMEIFFISSPSGQDEFNQEFSEFGTDMYALTTSLFITLYKRPPVQYIPTLRDPLYSLLRDNPDDFWDLDTFKQAEQDLMKQGLSMEDLESLKDLIECGLCDQKGRVTIEEWQSHEFWKDIECILTHEDCKKQTKLN